MPNSPAVDAGDSNGAPDTDQRGFARILPGDDIVDIGSVELQPDERGPHARSHGRSVLTSEIADIAVAMQGGNGRGRIGEDSRTLMPAALEESTWKMDSTAHAAFARVQSASQGTAIQESAFVDSYGNEGLRSQPHECSLEVDALWALDLPTHN